MGLRFSTLLVAAVMAISMAMAGSMYGAHSTPGIRLLVVNLPGVIVALWAGYLVGEGILFYIVCALANWAFYFYVAKGAIALHKRLSSN
jgi:hypothetical protein